jgi:carbohydrate-selective porin OprB
MTKLQASVCGLSWLVTTVAVTTVVASPAAADTVEASPLEQQWSLINDNSWLAGDAVNDVRQASRVLLTYDWQLSPADGWLVQGNLKAFRGRNGEQLTDNREGISNIDAAHFSKIYELFVQYQWADDQRLKCGQVDANLEFAMVPVGANFISPPLGITPTAIALPTYYDPALSCSYFYEPAEGFQWAAGVFAGRGHTDFADQFAVAEGRYLTSQSRTSWGYWRHNGDWQQLDDRPVVLVSGWYVNHQQSLGAQWSWFLVWSGLNDNVDVLHQHRMLGLVYQRPAQAEELGLVASQATGRDEADELMLEGYWQFSLHDGVQLQPVLQWIHYDQPERDANLVLTLRLLLQF